MSKNPYLLGLGTMNLAELPALIASAHPNAAELIELEWKIQWDFSPTNPKRAELAKHIIAMANRDPDQAARIFGGHAYIVIGAEPGNLQGAPALDPADLTQLLLPYIGTDLNWYPANVDCGGTNVLVIVVDPPRWGDPIHTMCRASGDPESGERFELDTVYVRRPGTSAPATEDDIRRLEARAGTPRPRVSVSSTWNLGKSGQYLGMNVANEPQGSTAEITELGFMFSDELSVETVGLSDEEHDGDAGVGFGALPFDPERFKLEPAETHEFRWNLGHVPDLIDPEILLYPYCYATGGGWIIGEAFRLADIVAGGWEIPEEGRSMFPMIRIDYMHPPEKRDTWMTLALSGWEDVDQIPGFIPADQ